MPIPQATKPRKKSTTNVPLVNPKMTRRRHKRYPALTPEQQNLVAEHKWISGRLAYGAKCQTGGHTGSLTREDLESIANFALCVAATRYRPDMGVKYSTYAWNTARGYIQHALRDYSRMVRTPRWIANYKNQVSALIQEGKTYKEIAEILDLDEVKVMHCELSTNNYHVSYDSSPEDWVTPQFVYNFEEHKEATKDVANAPLVALSIDELNNVYAKYFEWFKSNKSIVNQEYYDRYVAQYIF